MSNKNDLTKKTKKQQAKRKPLVYAVASGPRPGIYFGWKHDTDLAIRHENANFRSFVSQAEAEQYLLQKHPELLAPENSGWMSAKSRTAILYQRRGVSSPLTVARDDDDDDNDSCNNRNNNNNNSVETFHPLSPPRPEKRARRSTPSKPSSPCISNGGNTTTITNRGVSLDPIQQKAVEAALNGKNVFLTGTKSHVSTGCLLEYGIGQR
jgi:hypothetical protein